MTAKEAREISDTFNQTQKPYINDLTRIKVNAQISELIESIRYATTLGNYMFLYSALLEEETIKHFIELGYTVTPRAHSELSYVISWKE